VIFTRTAPVWRGPEGEPWFPLHLDRMDAVFDPSSALGCIDLAFDRLGLGGT
jgi:hypothetical protein